MKDILKELKLNESIISMALGGLVILIVGILVVSNFRGQSNAVDIVDVENDVNVSADVEEKRNEYVVEAGDSLWTISEEVYGTGYEWTKIAQANPEINTAGEIEVGQNILIPSASEASPDGVITEEAASTTSEVETAPEAELEIADTTESTTEDPQDNQYLIQKGDTLWHIAEATYGDPYRWVDIAQANNLANPDLIHTGNSLLLPA